ncbi:hypothetical protein ACIBL6_14720 [Streptomyces sp. NPDC050400]|uniref:hypothetical protein n=1 Tax=Streptomyces sp. NPDC050400 TaxID=3365610 RepID=UPI0037AC277C
MSVSATFRRAAVVPAAALAVAALTVLTGCGSPTESSARPSGSSQEATPQEDMTGSSEVSPSASAEAPGASPAAASSPSPAASKSAPATRRTSSASASAPVAEPRWAGTRQFVQVKDAWTADGRIYVSVRPAEKKVNKQFDTWTVEPGTGSYVTVALTPDARTILCAPLGDEKQPADYPQTQLISRLKTINSSEREGLGYNLTFDGKGRVTLLEQVYRA